MNGYKDRRVLVVGLAKSGIAAIKVLAAAGARVMANDLKPASELTEVLPQLSGLPVEIVLGGHPDHLFNSADLIVLSPGVPRDLPQLAAAREKGTRILSELEFAARQLSAPMIAVTGTNGKSTTVSLIGEIMKAVHGADRVFVGGNLGTPLAELLVEPRPVELLVVEVSSFQLEYAPTLKPRVAVMLNLTPDHLDRYRDFQDYAETKWKIFANMRESDSAVMVVDDPITADRFKKFPVRPRVMTVSLTQAPDFGMWLAGESLEYRTPEGKRETLPVREVPLHGRHNLINVMASACAALALGVDMTVIRRAVAGFKGLSHRLELTRELRGVKFYNDSKATNVGSVEADVMGLPGPLILLMGGLAKGCSFGELGRKIQGRVKQVVAFGQSRRQLQEEMGDRVPVSEVETLPQALQAALELARPGDAVLLAPGGSSFDQFKDYRHRGEVFERLVKELV